MPQDFDPDAWLKATEPKPFDPDAWLKETEPQNYFADKARRIGREIPKVIGDIVASPGSAIESGTELLAEGMRRVAVKRGDLTPEEATQKKQEFLDRASREPAGLAAATAREVGQQLRDVGPRHFAAPDPARNGEIGSAVASGAASLVPLLAAGSVAPLAAIPAAAGMMGEQQRQDAEEKGATPTQQAAAFALGAPVGAASEALLGVPALLKSVAAAKPAAAALGAAGTGLEAMATRALGKLAPAILPVAKQAVKSAVREGVQEGLEQIAQNTIAKDVVGYDPTRDRTEGVGMAMVGGAIVGGGVGAAHQAAADLDPRNRAQRDLDEALQAQRAAKAKKLAREQAQPEPTTTAAPAQPSAESSGQPAPAPSRPSLVAEMLAQDAKRAAAEREAAAKEVAERNERQKELADKKARFDERIALARQAYADPAATYADIEGARKTIAFYADDNSLGLTQQQREQAIAAESALSTKAAQLKPAFEAQAEQERTTREQAAAAEAAAQKAARSDERATLRHLAATGRDRATGLIADLARVPAEELQALDLADPKNRLADGTALDEPRVLAELERRAQDEERAAATATNRGEELGDVLRRVKIPSSSETLSTELSDLIREGMTDRQRMTLLSGKPGELDRTAESLRAEGFRVETPADVIDLLDRHLRGEKIYGDKPDFATNERVDLATPSERIEAAQNQIPFSIGGITTENGTRLEKVPPGRFGAMGGHQHFFGASHGETRWLWESGTISWWEKPTVETRIKTEDALARKGIPTLEHRIYGEPNGWRANPALEFTHPEVDAFFRSINRPELVAKTRAKPRPAAKFTEADLKAQRDQFDRGETPFATREAPTAPTTPAALTDEQVAAQFDTLRRTLGRTAREFDLQAGIVADVLEREGYAKEAAALRAGRLGSIQAGTGPRLREKIDALRAQQRFIVVAAEAARRGEAPGLVLHELAHPFFDALPTETRALMREMHAEETGTRTGPLYRDGKKTTKIAITADSLPASRVKADPDLPVKEWFAERVRALNAEWLDGRMQTEQRPLIMRLWRQMLDRLQAIFAQVRGLDSNSDLFTDTFRDWLRTGTKEDITRTSLAYARQRRAEFANFQDTLDLGSTPLGLNLPNEIRNLSPRWQDKTLIFDSSLDKALYYAGGTNSETRARITQAIAEQTKLTPGQIATLARDLRQQIAPLARNAANGGTVRVPAQMRAKARQLTGIDFAQNTSPTLPKPWAEKLRDAQIMTSVAALRSHEMYREAKTGSTDHAWFVVTALINPTKLKALHDQHPDAILAPVIARERQGNNRLPRALAEAMAAAHPTWIVDNQIVQRAGMGHTDASALARLANPAQFDGAVEAGKKYILIDDVLTSGATINALRAHIENGGGQVVAVNALAASGNPQTGAGQNLAPRPDVVQKLDAKFGRANLEKFLQEQAIAETPYALTNSQARYLLTFASLERARSAIAAARQSTGREAPAGNRGNDSRPTAGTAETDTATRSGSNLDFASESRDYVARNGTPDEKAPAARADIEQLLRTVNDDQLDLFDYARGSRAVERSEAPRSDDGRPAQLQREADALKNPTNSAALRAAYGLEGQSAEQTTRISSIIPELIKDPKRTWDIRGARIKSPRDLLTLINVMRTPYVETTKIILLNDKNEVVHSEVMSVGAISAAMLDANMIARVMSHAPQSDLGYNVILSHNHPSGNPTPSAADTSVTRALREVLRGTKHQLKDHVVTNGDTYYSYAENGYTDTSGKKISQVTPEKRGANADQKAPIGALAPWEKIARAELPFANRSETTMEILGALRQVDPSALHVIYLNRKNQIMGFERMPDFKLPLDSSVDPIGTTVFEGLGREGAIAFILGAPDNMPTIEAARLMRSMREFAKTANFEFLDYTAKTFTGDTTARLMGVLEEPTNDPQARLADVEQRLADLANSQEDATEIDARGKALSAERDQIKREIAAEEQQAATAAALRPASEIKATDTERSQRHPAAIADPEPGDAWAMTPKMDDAQLEQERKAITRYIGDRYTELSAIERALLNARIDALKAEQDRRVIDAAPRVEALPKVDRQAALEGELRRGRELRDEGSRTGNATAEAEGVRLVRLATERLDEEFPGWDKKKATTPPEPPEPPKDTTESAQPDDQEPSPFDRPEREIPVRAGKFDEIYGQDTYHPTPLAKTWQKAREALAGFRGPIPELPTFPNAWWNRADQFIRDHGPQFYNRIKEGVRALNSGNDYIQRTAEEQVARITTPLLKAGNKLDATNYARLSTLQEKARRLTAEQKPIPRSMRAEISALNRQLESSPYVLFNRLVLALDLNWRHENLKDDQGRPISLPANVNAAELRAELARLGERIEASGHKEIIRTALEQHMAMVKQIGNDLRARELLADTHLSNPYYFPHITLETTRGGKTEQRELRPQRVRPGTEADFRGYLVTPVGSAKPISTDYVRSMYYHLVQVGAHNFKADAVRDFFRPYDVMKAVRDRAKELSRSRGVPVSWQQAFAEEYAPRGYVLYGTDSRDAFPTVSIDRDKLARRMGVMLTSDDLHQQLADLGLKGIKLLPEDLTETLQQGARETWVLPARVAESLRGVADRMQANDGAVDAAAKWTLGRWKAWKLFMPWNHVRYEYGNIVADAEKIFSASPSTIRQLPAAFREIRDFWQGKEPGADLRAALKEGVINAITAQELGSLNRMKAFEDFQTRTERLQNQLVRRGSSIVYQPITNLLGLGDLSAPELSAFREGVTRYAKFKADLEAIRNGARPNYAGAYWRDIEAIQDSRMGAKDAAERKAAAISKATFGDYGDLSINGQYIRDRLVPFYSWMEINFRYHANLLRNLHDMVRAGEKSRTEAIGAGTRAAAVAAAGFTARAAGGVALRLALPYMAVALWNSTGDRDDLEKLLSEEDRRRFHIIIGETKDGNTTLRDGRKIEVLYGQTALQDVTKWFGGAKFMQAMGQWMNGKTDFPTAFSTWRDQLVPDFLNNTIGSAGPYGKIPYALLSGKNTFPDITDQRTIPAYDMRRHILSQITDDFTADQIEAAINKDYYGSKDVGDWARQLVLQVRQRDPDQWAFYSIKDKAAKFVEERTGQKRDSAFDAPDQQVLRNFKRAIYRGDVEKAVQFYQRLLDYGYTSERFAASIRSQDPLSTLPKENGLRQQFVASLSPDDRAQLDRAYAYYERMATSRGREPLLFPSHQAGANGVRRYQAAPRTEQLRAMMEQTGRMTDEEREARMQRDLRRSLQRN
jgi:DNA repair protein RadC